jgi:uncharacterized protein (DUF1330 family)
VVIEFKDYATALECYHSPEYAKAIAIRQWLTSLSLMAITVRRHPTDK